MRAPSQNQEPNENKHTLVPYELNISSVLGNAEGMVLHTRTPTYVTKNKNLGRDM